MCASCRDRVDYRSEIEDLFDEFTEKPETFEDISISSSVYEPVLVGLKEKKLETRLEKAFYPQHDTEIAFRDAEGNSLILPVEELQFLAFVNRPLQIDNLNTSNVSEVIETIHGSSFEIHVPIGQDFEAGFFGITTDPADRYKYIFFNFNNVRIRYQQRPIGEIIIERSLLSEDLLQDALYKQSRLRSLRLGEIIAKRANLLPHKVETTLQQAWHEESRNYKPQSGDILIEAGLVSPQAVKQALAIQKKIRHMQVGKLLVELGYVNENQIYEVLAEKFRKRFISLERISIADDALEHLPHDLVRKLRVIPIHFQNNRLIIATSFPDKVELSDVLRERLSCPFELVVSPYKQINAIIVNYFRGESFAPYQISWD
jgi:hypothetical protein